MRAEVVCFGGCWWRGGFWSGVLGCGGCVRGGGRGVVGGVRTAGVVGVAEPELQAGGGRVVLAAVWRVQQHPEVLLKGVQQALQQGVVWLVRHVHQLLGKGGGDSF